MVVNHEAPQTQVRHSCLANVLYGVKEARKSAPCHSGTDLTTTVLVGWWLEARKEDVKLEGDRLQVNFGQWNT